MSRFFQDGGHILTHEVHAQNSHSGAALLSHLDSPICHDQAVTDVDVGPASSCTAEHSLDLRVHVKVGHYANLLLRQHLQMKQSYTQSCPVP